MTDLAVDAYLASLPADRRAVVEELRWTLKASAPGGDRDDRLPDAGTPERRRPIPRHRQILITVTHTADPTRRRGPSTWSRPSRSFRRGRQGQRPSARDRTRGPRPRPGVFKPRGHVVVEAAGDHVGRLDERSHWTTTVRAGKRLRLGIAVASTPLRLVAGSRRSGPGAIHRARTLDRRRPHRP